MRWPSSSTSNRMPAAGCSVLSSAGAGTTPATGSTTSRRWSHWPSNVTTCPAHCWGGSRTSSPSAEPRGSAEGGAPDVREDQVGLGERHLRMPGEFLDDEPAQCLGVRGRDIEQEVVGAGQEIDLPDLRQRAHPLHERGDGTPACRTEPDRDQRLERQTHCCRIDIHMGAADDAAVPQRPHPGQTCRRRHADLGGQGVVRHASVTLQHSQNAPIDVIQRWEPKIVRLSDHGWVASRIMFDHTARISNFSVRYGEIYRESSYCPWHGRRLGACPAPAISRIRKASPCASVCPPRSRTTSTGWR